MTANTVANRHQTTIDRARDWARKHGSLASLPGRHPLAEALRRLIRRDRLTPAERVELNRLGLSLDRRADRWRMALDRLAAYCAKREDGTITARYVEDDGFRLGLWVHWQKQQARRGRLPDWKRQELERLGYALPHAN